MAADGQISFAIVIDISFKIVNFLRFLEFLKQDSPICVTWLDNVSSVRAVPSKA